MRIVFALFMAFSIGYACDKNSSSWVIKKGEAYNKTTHLTWRRCSLGLTWEQGKCVGEHLQVTFVEAKKRVEEGYSKWRIPTIEEMMTLVDETCVPAINTNIFPDISVDEDTSYWTQSVFLDNTSEQEMPALLYTMDFVHGSVDAHTQGLRYRTLLVK